MADSDNLYHAILDNLYDGVYFVDRDRKITYWNKGAERITGYPAAEVVGSRCFDNILMHVDGHGTLLCKELCPLAATMLDGVERTADVYLQHKDGHRVSVNVRITPLRNEGGAVTGGVEVFTDNSQAFRHRPDGSLRKACLCRSSHRRRQPEVRGGPG